MSAPTADRALLSGPGDDGLRAQLERMSVQLAEIAAAQEAERRERQRWADLVHELTPVAHAALELASDELTDLTRDVTVEDAARFARTLARSLPQLESLVRELVGVRELLGEVTSLTGAGMGALSDALDTAQQRGYFAAAKAGGAVLDRMAGSLARPGPEQAPSALALLKQLRDPQVRLGLARALELLRALGAQPQTPTRKKD